ncbi:uncharacterized protein DUF4209 [Rhodoglobus vestalii]|uniref:Uncharacterized protein DUF4209 n=1 Tax=Rhodoglobus vestalii TaxID=193384 RepID=A0A8H2K8C1_9MICO|nr:DUF4209 domain-containing protein [Rhodoglobus vestalii]TQO19922.1 uncharacterized protein DUF4209 [Rhodoglobus vestalii]
MAVPEGSGSGVRWAEIIGTQQFQDALAPTETGLIGLDSRLLAIVAPEADTDVQHLGGLLATVASFWVRIDDFQDPYGPMIELVDGRRSQIPSDLSEADLEVLSLVVDLIPDLVFRSRVLDVLALHGDRTLRPQRHVAQVQALIDNRVAPHTLVHAHEQWDRGISVAVRFGAATRSELDSLVQLLVDAVENSSDGSLVVTVARLLRKHGLAGANAASISARLLAVTDSPNSIAARHTLEEAASWFRRAGDTTAAEDALFAIVQGLVAEADASAQDNGRGGLVAAVHLEDALQTLRTLPKSARERLGAGNLTANLARRIREAGATSLGQMHIFQSESIDLSGAVRELLEHLTGVDSLEAMRRFAGLQPFNSYDQSKADAERAVAEHPLSNIFPVSYFSHDGRTVYRSGTGDDVELYGETGPVWRQMVQTYQIRIDLLGGVLIPHAWRQMTSEHRLTLRDFEAITKGSTSIPPGSAGLYARGLFHGYNGDFASAAHLLSPRIETLVRYHLANAGEKTSAIDSDGLENEVGLSSLMKNEFIVEILGPDIAFEIRALLCGPIGPNVRNDVAHGLVDDSISRSTTSVYLWWFAIKLAFIPYWNALHDADAADGREHARPVPAEQEPDGSVAEEAP